MADVRSALDDAAAEARGDRAETFGRQDRARVVFVARRRRALVLSIPPTIVESANGSAIGRYAHASEIPPRKANVGQGTERWRGAAA
jgi:hypothetical protein